MTSQVVKYKKYSSKLSLLVLSVCAALQLGDWLIARYFPILLCVAILTVFQPLRGLKSSQSFKIVLTLNIFCLLLLVFISFIGNSPPEEFLFDFVKLFLAFISSIWFFYFVIHSSSQTIYKSIITMTLIVQSVMIIVLYDLYSDFSFSSFTENFYRYKTNTIHFYDSNALAIYGLVNFSVLLYFYRFHKKTRFLKLLLYSFIPLLMFCVSRSVIIALSCILLYDQYKRLTKFLKFILITIIILLFLFNYSSLFGLVDSDGSGKTKLNIYLELIELFPAQNLRTILFGEGINLGNYTYSYEYGKYSHALVPMLLGQFGFIGTLIYFLYFYLHSLLLSSKNLYSLIPLFIAGLSYLHPFLESLFIANAIVIGLEVKRLQK